MKPRCTLSHGEVIELQGEIDRRLTGLGVETQPGVASRILALTADPDAGLRQYADVLRNDVALTGRLLRLANSALFAQIRPVTTLDRACVLLGLERLKAVSLGFYLSRAAATDHASKVSRRVWGESVLRACLSAELARDACPGRAPEAFTIGLMLDAGTPLLHRMLGKPVERILSNGEPPERQFALENESLPFTHVDVAAALLRRWRLPEILARPIEWHHAPPVDAARSEPEHVLHRIAFYAGSVTLSRAPVPAIARACAALARSVLGVRPETLAAVLRRADAEHSAIRGLFSDVADEVCGLAAMAERVHAQLLAMMDRSMADSVRQEAPTGPTHFTIGGHRIEIELDTPGRAVAYLSDERGQRLIAHEFEIGRLDAAPLLDALGLDPASAEQTRDLQAHLRAMAA